MQHKTAAELARYYLMSHGMECSKITSFCYFDFEYKGQEARLRCWYDDISVQFVNGYHFDMHMNFHDVDETNPEFNPEIFFKPILNKITDYRIM